jgi:prepilin-type N-terminal cleavage/methylation domain-containing protein
MKSVRPTRSQVLTRGVTLLEMLIVVAIIAIIVSVSFPSLTAGLAGVRLSSAAGSVASFLTSALNNVDRREEAAAVVISPRINELAIYTAASANKPAKKFDMPAGISIEGDEPRRFLLFPGGACPRIVVVLRNEKGARRSIQIDPVTSVPKIQRLPAGEQT